MQLKTFDFYSLGHAARAVGVSQSSLYQWSRSGKVRTLRASDGSRLIERSEVEKLKDLVKQSRRKLVEQPD